ncbi:ATP-binding protein [Actinomadura parmotrematis]|uniref:Helix-turn-helix domain-containing protein n=1 Tax=Actinomadura parmotrematis TaxID=2864039 RepID=A0ABS7FK51_9ACTN|nr:helix-turn-helix domain-containing protein [Actinomadura parmotrematis]MBW8480741.1 helix-turn-helix domain-containing protein [Actinomadura parmotrematis]
MGGPVGFGELLRDHRLAAGLTIEGLADASGVSVRAIGDMERGRSRSPQRRSVAALAAALGLPAGAREELADAARGGRRPAPAAPGGVSGVSGLPRGVRDFTGRAAELGVLDRLAGAAGGPGPVVVAALSGGPGLGKTALAVRAAEHLAPAFPGGSLFVDLRGMDEAPLAPGDALARLLHGLGVADRHVPRDLQERAGLYRTLLRDRRALIVLDNAADEAQVRPLLPGDGPGMVLLTSRRTLAGLEGVHHLPLPEMTSGEAVALLRTILTAVRPGTAGDAELAGIARLCGNLPLALRIAANRLLSRPAWSVADLAARLAGEERRLQALSAGDLHIAAAFALSYRQLSEGARTAFRRLAPIPGPHFGAPLAALLAGTGTAECEEALEELVELGLLQMPDHGRYRLHDLVRLFARDRFTAEEDGGARRRLREEMEDRLLHTAIQAGRWFEPGYGAPPDDPGLAPLETSAEALAWLQAESVHWLPALRSAAAAGRHRRVADTAEAMHWFSERWTHWGHWTEVFGLAAAAGRALGDPALEATHLNYLSWAASVAEGRHREGVDHALAALDLARAAGDARQEAWSFAYVAFALRHLGEWERVADHAGRAAAMFERLGDWDGYPQAVNVRGDALRHLGRPEEALRDHLALIAVLTDPSYAGTPSVREQTLGLTLRRLGECSAALGRWDEAAAYYARAVPPLRDQRILAAVPSVQRLLGGALARLERWAEARAALGEAVGGFELVGERLLAGEVRAEIAALPAG